MVLCVHIHNLAGDPPPSEQSSAPADESLSRHRRPFRLDPLDREVPEPPLTGRLHQQFPDEFHLRPHPARRTDLHRHGRTPRRFIRWTSSIGTPTQDRSPSTLPARRSVPG